MIKLIAGLVTLVIFVLIVVVRRVRISKQSSQEVKVGTINKTESFEENSEFEVKNKLLDLFLQAQEAWLLATTGETKLIFSSEREKLLYLHFVLGAIDQLSKSIKNEEEQELWITTTSIA